MSKFDDFVDREIRFCRRILLQSQKVLREVNKFVEISRASAERFNIEPYPCSAIRVMQTGFRLSEFGDHAAFKARRWRSSTAIMRPTRSSTASANSEK